MQLFIVGLIFFFAVHSVSIINDSWRDAMAQRLGERPWRVLHGLASLVGLVLLIWGYGIARNVPVALYTAPDWLRHVNYLLMLFVFPLLLAVFFTGAYKIRSEISGFYRGQDLGVCTFAGERRPCRCAAVRLLSDLGGRRAYLHEISPAATCARISGNGCKRPHRLRGRPWEFTCCSCSFCTAG